MKFYIVEATTKRYSKTYCKFNCCNTILQQNLFFLHKFFVCVFFERYKYICQDDVSSSIGSWIFFRSVHIYKAPHLCVNSKMTLYTFLRAEFFVAEFTFIGLLTGMNSDMAPQIIFSAKFFAAVFTFERFFTSVTGETVTITSK